MPFVKSPPMLIGHMQEPDDPVRAAAENEEANLRMHLLAGWDNASAEIHDMREFYQTRYTGISALARGLSQKVIPCANDLLAARLFGQIAMQRQIGEPIRKDLKVNFQFNQTAAATQEQAALNAGQFVREIGNDLRSTLNQMVQDSIGLGLSPADTGRVMRESIGLTVSQARAVQNYRRLLETGSPVSLERALRDKRFDVAPQDLMSLTPEQIDQRVEAYRRRYLAYRATTIARYETLAAANGGAVHSIQSSVQAGVLPATTTVGWLIANDERTCERCRSIVKIQPNGVKLGQPFHWREGAHSGQVFFAPLHPDCRCTNTFRIHR